MTHPHPSPGASGAIADLIERLEKADGPDRALDAALHVALVKPEQYPDDLRYFRLPCPSMDHMEMCAPGTYWLKQRSGYSLQTAPPYTASLDAALALCERVLPGWRISAELYWKDGALLADDLYIIGPRYRDDGSTPDQEAHAGEWTRPAALALLAALITAMMEQEK